MTAKARAALDSAAPEVLLAGLRRVGRFLLIAALVLGIGAAWHWRATLDPVELKLEIDRYPAAPLVFLAAHVAASLFFVPRTLLAIVAGLLFGMGYGLFWATLGSVLGAIAGFLVARYVNAGLVDLENMARIGPLLQKIERGGWRTVAIVRLIPILPHSLANYAMGLTRLPLLAFAVGSLLGQLPMTIAYVDLGAAGERLMLGGAGWVEPTLIGFGALGISLLIPAWSAWRRRAAR